MNKPFLTLVFCLITWTLSAQGFDDVVQRNRYIKCNDVRYSAANVILDLFHKNELDSIYQFLDYWEDKCGEHQQIIRFRTILDIKTGQFNSEEISTETIGQMMLYRAGIEDSYPMFYRPDPDITNTRVDLDSVSRLISREVLLVKDLDEHLIVDYYSMKEPNFELIRETDPEESRLSKFYHELYAEASIVEYGKYSIGIGYARHLGNSSIFGVRPTINFSFLGIKYDRHALDFIIEIRIGPSKSDYTFGYFGTPVTHDKYTGGYLGIEYGFDLIHKKRFDMAISPGIGHDFITVLSEDNRYGEESKSFKSVNLNLGLVFRYRVRETGIGEIHFRYNWVDYNNTGGTDLDGGYFSVRGTYGLRIPTEKARQLRLLE